MAFPLAFVELAADADSIADGDPLAIAVAFGPGGGPEAVAPAEGCARAASPPDELLILVRPARQVEPDRLARLGLTKDQVANAFAPPEAAAAFLTAVRGAALVAENAESAGALIERLLSMPPASDIIGLDALGPVVEPTCPSHDLAGLLRHLGMSKEHPDLRGSLPRVRALRAVFARLWGNLLDLPLPALAEMNYLVGAVDHPAAKLLKSAEAVAVDRKFAESFRRRRMKIADLFEDFGDLVEARREESEEAAEAPVRMLEPKRVAAALEPGGPLAAGLGALYEERPQQYEMASAVCDAFNRGAHAMVEAGTGVGKSLAYLVPAILWAKSAGRPAIVSTHTKNLQSQLFDKDLPFLRGNLGVEFASAILKGRGNYLCVRRLLYILGESRHELTDAERMRLLPVISWAVRTKTGDVAENLALLAEERGDLWGRLSTVGEDCLGRSCHCFRKCFVYRARGLAHRADIVVINHALFFAELGLENGTLPRCREVVFDEAHNIEDVATEHLSSEVCASRVFPVLNRLFRGRRRRGHGGEPEGKGLLPSLMHSLSGRGTSDHEAAEVCRRHLIAAMKAVVACPDALQKYLEAFAQLAAGEGESDRKRFSAESLTASQRDSIGSAKAELIAAFGAIRRPLEEAGEALVALRASKLQRLREYRQEIAASLVFLGEVIRDVEFVSGASEANYVYFVEKARERSRYGVRVAAAPLDLSALLHGQLFDKVRACVLTSATLRCGPGFQFLKDRLGLSLCPPERAFEVAVGTPFDYARQSRVFVPSFLPDPSDPAFGRRLAETLVDVFRVAKGRGLVLYTSYRALDEGREALKGALAPEGFSVLAQGVDGTREGLLDRLRHGERTILLGTSSFWEGIDVRGEALSVLVIAKLPFAVFTDPIHQGRCEILEAQGTDPFMNLSVPVAVLRLRQGFGRLIRSRTDRGVVILADKRLLTRRYGSAFLRALPVRHQAVNAEERLIEMVGQFLST